MYNVFTLQRSLKSKWSVCVWLIAASMSASLSGCLGAGPLGSTVAAALQFFAASQCLLQEPYPRQANVINGSSFDFIIVGGGTAGSALAARLADVAHFQVLLVEAGGDPPPESIVPAFRRRFRGSSHMWNFATVDDGYSSQALANHREKLQQGKLLGGGGSINGMVYSRGHPADYNEWADLIGDTWNWTEVLPYFMKTEQMTDKRIINNSELMKLHGIGGEIEVSGSAELDHFTTKFLEGFVELGIDLVDDMTNPYKIGAGRFSQTIRDGQRHSTLTALLNKAANNDNLHVLKNTLVVKVLTHNTTAVGIKAVSNGEEFEFFANNEVIVSAGTFNTAKLLLLSGVGPKDYLDEIGIDVVQDLPVGDNLHDHVKVVYYVAADNGTCGRNDEEEYFNAIEYLHDRSGSWSYSDNIGVFLPQRSHEPNVPYFAITPISCVTQAGISYEQCLSSMPYTEETCSKLAAESEQNELISLAIVLLKPQSRGKVRLLSSDPMDYPAIYSGTFSNVADLEEFPEAIRTALSLANTTYFKKKGARVIDLTPEKCIGLYDDAMIRCQARELATTSLHSVGTAAMGAVLDAELRVRGLQGLRVVDASAMPTVIRGNTNAPVVMIAEKAADLIKNTYRVDN